MEIRAARPTRICSMTQSSNDGADRAARSTPNDAPFLEDSGANQKRRLGDDIKEFHDVPWISMTFETKSKEFNESQQISMIFETNYKEFHEIP